MPPRVATPPVESRHDLRRPAARWRQSAARNSDLLTQRAGCAEAFTLAIALVVARGFLHDLRMLAENEADSGTDGAHAIHEECHQRIPQAKFFAPRPLGSQVVSRLAERQREPAGLLGKVRLSLGTARFGRAMRIAFPLERMRSRCYASSLGEDER